MEFIQTLSGFAVGLIVGLTGVGGGSLMTPLLVLGFGIAPGTAVGTDLLYAAITKSGGVWVHARRGSVNWRIVLLLAGGSLPASTLTVTLIHFFALDAARFNSVVTTVLGVALILTAIAIVFRRRLQALGSRTAVGRALQDGHPAWVAPITMATGALLGVLVTISSVGAGALGVAVLYFLYPRLSALSIVGTDIAHAVPLTLIAGLGHATLGTINWTLLGSLMLGSLPGIYIGSHLAARVPESWLRSALATMLVVIGGKFVF